MVISVNCVFLVGSHTLKKEIKHLFLQKLTPSLPALKRLFYYRLKASSVVVFFVPFFCFVRKNTVFFFFNLFF